MNLSDTFNGDDGNPFEGWDSIDAAKDLSAIPKGIYVCRVSKTDIRKSGTRKPFVFFELNIIEGEYTGRKLFRSLFLTGAAKPFAKRDLAKIGVTNPAAQLATPFPTNVRLAVKAVIRTDDDGTQRNECRDWSIVGIDPESTVPAATPAPNPFAPAAADLIGADIGDAYEGPGPYGDKF